MTASLPPSSRVTRFRVAAHAAMTFFPVSVDLVKLTLATSGWAVSMGPRLSPPLRAWKTPGGKILAPDLGQLQRQVGREGDGFQMKVFLARSAGTALPMPRARGKF